MHDCPACTCQPKRDRVVGVSVQHGSCRRVEIEREVRGSVDGTYWKIYRPFDLLALCPYRDLCPLFECVRWSHPRKRRNLVK